MIPERVERLSARDRDLISKALTAAVDGPYFPDWEMHSLMALDRDELAQVRAAWPEAAAVTSWEDDPERVQFIAVNNVLNNLFGYPHDMWALLRTELDAEPADVIGVLRRWRGGPVKSYFDATM